MDLAKQSTRFSRLKMPDDLAREFKLLRLSFTLAAPSDPKEALELTNIAARMEGSTVAASIARRPNKCLDLDQLSDILRTSTDPKTLTDAWRGWHTVSPPMRPLFGALCRAGKQRCAGARLRGHGRDVALQNTTSRRTPSPPKWTAYGT